ncbi:MAG: L-2,4-diaminobutyrate decarboxylase [Candidatus Accumulibacter appositus]|uniref:L-2,4-diaminobutyrate decarboxylase n=1 Tax=Candidatus Accumulibacter appositus TaxID=1454003 RepID=A0A011NJ34_9PROT|nr:pyridoxal-dependent decarboxylase [Accumulibacter sp.]EXI82798.1 MAG: L-2,4-diaminobutyrate decarboxylase [Candidatus Accumulibacter appositus]HRF05050.1 pyridoxal-dependent decarboxylase [Accumulibacter sp.]
MKSESAYPQLLRQTLDHALAYLEALPEAPVAATASLEELRARLGKPLPAGPVDPLAVVDRLVRDVAGGLTHSSGGRFFSWVIGGKLPASLAADWLTSTWDQNAGMFAVAPAAAVVEEVCGRWLLDLLHLPSSASFALVTGCQMAHVTCLAAARNAVLAAKGWDVEQRGLIGAPPIRVLSGDQRHGTIERAVRLLGLGRDCVIDIATDNNGQLRAGPLRAALASAPAAAHIVLLQAGDLNTGSFDPYDEIIPVAREFDAWVHVDGAFGLWAAASPEYRHFTKGVENADSWATDGHKWLNVPYDSGFAFVANRAAHYRSMAHHAAYLDHSAVARDQVDWNPEYSRRGRGFATYAAIASLGRQGIAQMVAECCQHAHALVTGAGKLPGVEVLHVPHINQGLLRFPDPSPGASEEDHDRRTEAVTARIVASGEAHFACTTWRGRRCMRVSVCSCATDAADIVRAIAAISNAL